MAAFVSLASRRSWASALLIPLRLLPLLAVALQGAAQEDRRSLRRAPSADGSSEEARAVLKRVSKGVQIAPPFDDDLEIDRQLYQTRDKMLRTFDALPKNQHGRLSPRAVRYLVQRYFSGARGWLITGLETHFKTPKALNLSSAQEVEGLFPAALEELFEARQQGRGLSVIDLASIAYLLDLMVVHESGLMLSAAYDVYGLDPSETLSSESAELLLPAYLALIRRGQEHQDGQSEAEAARELEHVKRDLIAGGDVAQDVLSNFGHNRRHVVNPFNEPVYSHADILQMARSIVRESGAWHNYHCQEMKEELIILDPLRSGSVPLGSFYARSTDESFQESVEYLRLTGGLDEQADARGPRVRIANYLLGPGLCAASSMYASTCCRNECDVLMSEMEEVFRAPLADLEPLLAFVGTNLSSATVDAPRVLPDHLVQQLHAVAGRHDGKVPLHGRLFAQWLNAAFPYECPFPHVPEDDANARVSSWMRVDFFASPEERSLAVEAWRSAGGAEAEPTWTFDDWEQLPLAEPLEHPLKAGRDVARIVVLLAMVAAASQIMRGSWQRACSALRGCALEKEQHLVF